MQDSTTESKLTVDELTPSVYKELRRLASRYLRNELPGHTLRPTALVHEVYLKLAIGHTEWHDKLQFLTAAARAMRQILIDHAKSQLRLKRGCRPKKVTLSEEVAVGGENAPDLLDLDKALERLAQHDIRKGRIIELLFFGGLTYDECAAVMEISPMTLYRELRAAKAWLYSELTPVPRPA
ncbi:MAG: sigma-70 family RNA polymerase sigma factor [Acidobacteriaceae bacterium]|nr:sigma-70 family RNA polymerase sigma factor [Acidobacteriaceae bacterium]MBV8570402.1 sigma-70 family RNA polymerase sigma factor [Acidobacteriaceae bacterium]